MFAFIIDIKVFNIVIKSFVNNFKSSKGLINIIFITNIIYFSVENKVIFKRNEIIILIIIYNLYFIYDIIIDYF